jgi:hypothetical protein
VRFCKKGGEYRWHRVRAFPDQDGQTAHSQWYETVDDIDDRVQLEIALRNWSDSLEDRVEELIRRTMGPSVLVTTSL